MQILFGRYMTLYKRPKDVESSKARIIADYLGLWEGMQSAVWVAVFGGGSFYCLMNVDYSGGKLWPLIVTLLIPCVIYAVKTLCISGQLTAVSCWPPWKLHSDDQLGSSLLDDDEMLSNEFGRPSSRRLGNSENCLAAAA